MSKMSELDLTITEYLEEGDNVYRIASVLNVPLEQVQEIEARLFSLENVPYETYIHYG
jgi:hypothetical protein